MTLRGSLEGRRKEVIDKLTSLGVECRPIVAGNFMKNPVIDYMTYLDHNDYDNANYIHDHGLFIGNDVRDLKENLDMVEIGDLMNQHHHYLKNYLNNEISIKFVVAIHKHIV